MPDYRAQYEQKVREAARRYGIPEQIYVNMIAQESQFNPNARNWESGAAGIAQFMPATAKDLGIDPMNPDQAIDAGARYLAQLQKLLNGDLVAAVAAYNYGPGNVGKAIAESKLKGGTWQDRIPAETQKYLSAAFANDQGPSTAGRTGASGYAEPQLEDYAIWSEDLEGNRTIAGYDVGAFNQARAQYDAFTASKEEDFGKYLDDVIASIGLQLESGQLNVNKANLEFRRRLDAFAEGGQQMTNLLGYALPVGQEYVTGREPGGFYEQMGLAPQRASGIVYDPIGIANEIVNSTPNLMEIDTPQVGPNVFNEAMQIARQGQMGNSYHAAAAAPSPVINGTNAGGGGVNDPRYLELARAFLQSGAQPAGDYWR